MEHLDTKPQPQSPDVSMAGSSGGVMDHHHPPPPSYGQPYPDPSLLHFSTSDPSIGGPPIPFPSSEPSPLQYALGANAIASAQQQQHDDHLSKKEIKRRTKTGCLTCRKRRIKCDEAQPACNNCRKSKRECQGYDPVFRNHQQSPAALQPATSRAKQNAVQHLPSAQSAYPAPPAGYAAVQSMTYPVANMAHTHNEPQTFDFSTQIDPALQNHGSTGFSQPALFSPTHAFHQVDVKSSTIEELMEIGAPYPANLAPSQITDQTKLEVKALFGYYAAGLNKILETQWMQQNGFALLCKNQALMDKYALLLSRMSFTADQAPYENQINLTVEAHIIWHSLELCRAASQESESDGAQPETTAHVDVHETAARLEILQTLITNKNLSQSQVDELTKFDNNVPKGFNALSKQLLTRERNFWKHTARFLTLDPTTASSEAADTALSDMRGLLESKENRDIMYSVAVMRVWPHRLMEQEQKLLGEGKSSSDLDANDLKKVEVAKTFLTQQAGGRGTTPASQRVCGMILKSWRTTDQANNQPFVL